MPPTREPGGIPTHACPRKKGRDKKRGAITGPTIDEVLQEQLSIKKSQDGVVSLEVERHQRGRELVGDFNSAPRANVY